jgi:hypothetical protein
MQNSENAGMGQNMPFSDGHYVPPAIQYLQRSKAFGIQRKTLFLFGLNYRGIKSAFTPSVQHEKRIWIQPGKHAWQRAIELLILFKIATYEKP